MGERYPGPTEARSPRRTTWSRTACRCAVRWGRRDLPPRPCRYGYSRARCTRICGGKAGFCRQTARICGAWRPVTKPRPAVPSTLRRLPPPLLTACRQPLSCAGVWLLIGSAGDGGAKRQQIRHGAAILPLAPGYTW